jgi:hypothetical protein
MLGKLRNFIAEHNCNSYAQSDKIPQIRILLKFSLCLGGFKRCPKSKKLGTIQNSEGAS